MYELIVEGMDCPSCARAMKRQLAEADPEADVTVSLPIKTVRAQTRLSESQVIDLIEQAGYPVTKSRDPMVAAFECLGHFMSKQKCKKGELILKAKRDGVQGQEARYPLPL